MHAKRNPIILTNTVNTNKCMATVQIKHTQLIKVYILPYLYIVIAVCCCLILATRTTIAVSRSQVFTQTKEQVYFSDCRKFLFLGELKYFASGFRKAC